MALVGLAVHSEVSRRRQTVLLLVGIAGAALFYGDGMITPAISVLSAVEGLQVAAPVLKLYVVPITIAVLIGFFAVQSRGSERIGAYFGPIMAVWFIVLAISGLLQIVREPVVLAALKPVHAVGFLVSHDLIGLLALGVDSPFYRLFPEEGSHPCWQLHARTSDSLELLHSEKAVWAAGQVLYTVQQS